MKPQNLVAGLAAASPECRVIGAGRRVRHGDDRGVPRSRRRGAPPKSIDNPWIDHVWSPAMILDEVPATAPWTVLSRRADATTLLRGLRLHRTVQSETGNYRDNLIDGEPRLWIVLRQPGWRARLELVTVTADPTEGEAMFESGCDVIGTVPMPPRDRRVDRGLCRRVPCRATSSTSASGIARPATGGGLRRARRMTEQAAHEWSVTRATTTRASWRDGRSASRKRSSRGPKPDEPVADGRRAAATGCRNRCRAGIRPLQPARARGHDRRDRYHGVSAQGRPRTSAQCGAAKVLGARPRDPRLRQSRARIRL